MPTPSGAAADANAALVRRALRLAALCAYADALARRTFRTREDGVTARAEAAERFGREMALAEGAGDQALYRALAEVRGAVVEYLSRLVTDLAPVVTVEANVPLPSVWWAWRLYADPSRARELVERNAVSDPIAMPLRFQAIAPQATRR